MITLVDRICFVCNQGFKTKPCLVRIGKGIVCSIKCSNIKKSRDKKGIAPSYNYPKGNVPWNKDRKGLQMAWNKGLTGVLKATPGSFKKGLVPWNKGKPFLAGEKNPNYIDGSRLNKYPRSFNYELKDKIRKRDNFTCQNCSMTEEEHIIVYGSVLNIHHIDYIKKNLNESNLITLCISCNVRANYNRDFWKNEYENKMKLLLNTGLIMYPFISLA